MKNECIYSVPGGNISYQLMKAWKNWEKERGEETLPLARHLRKLKMKTWAVFSRYERPAKDINTGLTEGRCHLKRKYVETGCSSSLVKETTGAFPFPHPTTNLFSPETLKIWCHFGSARLVYMNQWANYQNVSFNVCVVFFNIPGASMCLVSLGNIVTQSGVKRINLKT